MPLRPIRTKREHQTALKEAEALWDAPEGSPKADRLEALIAAHWPEAIGPDDLGDPDLWAQAQGARRALLAELEF